MAINNKMNIFHLVILYTWASTMDTIRKYSKYFCTLVPLA